MKQGLKQLNIAAECKTLRWGLWQCPPFLFLIMGMVIIIAMLASYLLASRYVEQPEIAALVVLAVTAVLLVLGHAVIAGFNKIAEANRTKSEFLSVIPHHLRSPLSVFKWTLDAVIRDIQKNQDEKQALQFLTTLTQTSENMIQLENLLLEATRIEAKTFALKKRPFALDELTKSVVEEFRTYAGALHLTFSLHSDHDLPQVMGDPERTQIVIQNLIDNAIRYSKESGAIEIAIERDSSPMVRWTIRDKGIGIPEEQKQLIFSKFFRATNAQNKQSHGTGIGLYISRAIIELSDGKMSFSSKEGEGTTFWFTLPINNT